MMRLALGVIAAIAIPFAAWHLMAPDDRLATGLTVSPFGWPRLLFGHLAAGVPLAYCLACRAGPRGTTGVRIIIAVVVTGLGILALPTIGESLDETGAGMTFRCGVRVMIAVLVSTAWLAIAVRKPRATGLPWLAAIAFAFVPPLLYSHRLADSRAADFETYATSGRLVRAMGSLEGLRDLGSSRMFSGRSVAQLIPRLRKDLDRMTALASIPLRGNASPTERLQRAMLLVKLNRSAEAEELLRSIVSPSTEVWLVRASIAREAGRWVDLETDCREAIARHGSTDPRAMLEDAYDGLGEALRRLGRPEDAAATYRDAAARWPDRAGYYCFQLGLIAAERGQMNLALDQFSEALRLDPGLKPLVDPQLRKVHASLTGCLDRR